MLEAGPCCLDRFRQRESMHLLADDFGIEKGLGFDGHELFCLSKLGRIRMAREQGLIMKRGTVMPLTCALGDELGIRSPFQGFGLFAANSQGVALGCDRSRRWRFERGRALMCLAQPSPELRGWPDE